MSAVRLIVLSLFLPVAGCASNPAPSGAPSAAAAVSVDNQSSLDMDLYVREHEGAARLGFAPANQVTRFPLPPALITGSGLIQFEARPTRGGERVSSDAFTVHPGDTLSWVIPPQ
jgi:hypothetical protein